MNSKKVNYVNNIMNIVLVITLLLLLIFGKTIGDTVLRGKYGIAIFFKNGIVDLMVKNEYFIPITTFLSLLIFNIISAIQNKNNKKMLFWKIALCVSTTITMIQMYLYNSYEYEIEEWLGRVFFCFTPIILSIKNIVLIKKNKPIVLQVASYIAVIIISAFVLLDLLDIQLLEYVGVFWCVISIIMQLIYTNLQDDNSGNTERKKVNIIIYYILQTIISITMIVIVIYCLLVCRINNDIIKKQAKDTANKISEQSSYNKEELIVVERDSKYGFINEEGEEVINAEYDIISYLLNFNIDNTDCKFAFAKKDNSFYIILNNKRIIELKDNNNYFKNIYESTSRISKTEDKQTLLTSTGLLYLNISDAIKNVKDKSLTDEKKLIADNEEYDENGNCIYTYELENGLQMNIIEIEADGKLKYNLTTRKNNQVIQNDQNIVIPIDEEGIIDVYSNGNIPFCNLEKNMQGWYDLTTGQAVSLQGKYQILDVTSDNHVHLRDYNSSEKNEMIVDAGSGNLIAQGKYINKVDGGYIITDNSKKMHFIDENGNVKSQQYDLLIDISTENKGLLIGANKSTDGLDCKLMDLSGKILTKQNYSKISSSINVDDYYNSVGKNEYYFDEVYSDYYM